MSVKVAQPNRFDQKVIKHFPYSASIVSRSHEHFYTSKIIASRATGFVPSFSHTLNIRKMLWKEAVRVQLLASAAAHVFGRSSDTWDFLLLFLSYCWCVFSHMPRITINQRGIRERKSENMRAQRNFPFWVIHIAISGANARFLLGRCPIAVRSLFLPPAVFLIISDWV